MALQPGGGTKSKKFSCSADNTSRIRRNRTGASGTGADEHLLVGSSGSGSTEWRHRSYLKFSHNFDDVYQVLSAKIVLRTCTTSGKHFAWGKNAAVRIRQVTSSWSEGNNKEDVWDSTDYVKPSWHSVSESTTKPTNQHNLSVEFDVTKSIGRILPKTVRGPNGALGEGRTNYGFALYEPDEDYDNDERCVFYSRQHGGSNATTTEKDRRPYLIITYIPVNREPNAPILTTPGTLKPSSGTWVPETVDGTAILSGTHEDPDLQRMSAYEVRVFEVNLATGARGSQVWQNPSVSIPASPAETESGVFSVPLTDLRGALKSQTPYEWDARTTDERGAQGPFCAPRRFIITSQAPSVAVTNLGTVETLAGVKFGGTYSDPDGHPMAGYRVQLRSQAAVGDPIWDEEPPAWDTGPSVPTIEEVTSNRVAVEYAGRAVAAGTYSFRVQVEDESLLWSPWSYGTVTVTTDYVGHDPGDYDFATIADRTAPVRVALYKSGTKRGPGALLGYVDEPINLGASRYMNGAGEMYFTLPATHPYCPEIEPRRVHYAIQQWWGDRYRDLFYGLITDFDATPDEVVFYGVDYLGLWGQSVDERFNEKNADEPAPKGSKYVNRTISSVIEDQIRYHTGLEDSVVGFMTKGAINALPELVTIFSTYTDALSFMVGLIDSHKQGTGVQTRLYVHQTAPGKYEIRLIDRWGKDREAIQLEYGGLLNDFRVVGLGDFATRVAGFGQKRGEVKVLRRTGQVAGLKESEWGRVATTRFFPEVIDANDLQRRVDEAAAQAAKVGKRMALAIKADSLAVFDGWDIGDNIVINIDRGVVDTTRYGSAVEPKPDPVPPGYDPYQHKRGGWWTIIGAEFQFYADGHYDTVLTVLPKQTARAADPDLLPSRPGTIAPEWQVGYGIATFLGELPVLIAPTPGPFSNAFSPEFLGGTDGSTSVPPTWHPASTDPVVATSYIDLNTGIIYILGPDGRTYASAYNPADHIPDIPDLPGADTIPPDVPVVLDLDSDIAQAENGEDIVRLLIRVGFSPAPTDLDDLTHFVVQATRFTLQGTDDPDWGRALEESHLSVDKTGTDTNIVISPALANTTYYVRASARDQSGNRSGWSASVPVLTTRDNEGPARPEDASLHAGMNSIGVRWSPVGAADLSHYELRWKVAHEDVWTFARIRGTLLIIDGLANDVEYRVHVRSVDQSGNVLHDLETPDADGNPTYETRSDTDLDAGWVNAGTATPTALGGDSLVWTDGMIQNLFAGKLRADWLTAGTLTVGGGPGHVDAITVINAQGQPVGVWNTDGLRILGSNPNFYLVITESGLKIVDATNPTNPVDRVTLSPLGIDAASITFGSQRGGHNLIQNSSFELGSFSQSVVNYYAWDVRADWDATRVGADVNIAVSDTDVRMAAV